MATSAVASGARSMLRAASSRGRFASQAKSVPPMFRATARRSSLLSPLRGNELLYGVNVTLPHCHSFCAYDFNAFHLCA
uniref:Uncharacterized protein n=1 Tax=Brassica oleracea var. oleracea TaxID=109376 RepID=A0A0D3DWC8_BRAOL